jgi:Zn finger protein HypA/HybF involved in hydrogenase expression
MSRFSFQVSIGMRCRKCTSTESEIAIGVLTETDVDLAIGFAQFIKAKSIHPYFHLLTKENTMLKCNKKDFRFSRGPLMK